MALSLSFTPSPVKPLDLKAMVVALGGGFSRCREVRSWLRFAAIDAMYHFCRGRLVHVTVVALATLPGLVFASAVSAAPRLSVAYGVLGERNLAASVRVADAPRGARAVLESRTPSRRARQRARRVLSAGRARLGWRVPRALRAVVVRARIVSARGRTLTVGRWRTLRVSGAPGVSPVATVKARQVRSAPAPGQPGPVVLTGAPAVSVGEVLALGIGDATPTGLLARITAVTPAAGGTIVQTVPATLPEVLPVGQLDVRLDTAALRPRAAPKSLFGRAVTCDSGAEMQAGGAASVSAGVRLQAGWSFPFSITARFEGNVSAHADLSASVSGQASCTLPTTELLPAPARLGAYTFTVGPIPIVLVPTVQLHLAANASVQAAVQTSATASMTARAGVQYDGHFDAFGHLTPVLGFKRPALTTTGNAQATLTPTLDVLISGIGGPRVDLAAGLKLTADVNTAPWWTLTAPVSLGAQLRLDIWKLQLASDRLSIFTAEPTLADSDHPDPPVVAPPPPPTTPPGDCGTIPFDYERAPGERYTVMYLEVVSGLVTCTRAREVMARYERHIPPCPNDGGNSCRITYSDGWICQTPTAASFPRVQTCSRGGTVINGSVRR